MSGARHRILALLASATVLGLAGAAQASGKIYKWTDKDGVLHITNVRKGAHGVKVRADPTFQYQPGPTAPLAFTPNDVTAKYDAYIQEACAKYQIPPALVRAIMNTESNFNPEAMSDKGAMGLMQLMPHTGDQMFVQDILDPRENILGGVRYLRLLTNMFDGDMVRIVAAYNCGPNAVLKAGGVPQIAETQDYVRKVIHRYFAYKAQATH